MRFSAFILYFLFSVGTNAQAVLTGKVIDSVTTEPLVGANIYVKSNWQVGATTDVNGAFAVKGLLSGDILIISYVGYDELSIPFLGEAHVEIELQVSTNSMDEVVITAERLAAEEFTYKKIERLDIYLNPSAKADPLLAVNSLPSSTTLDESANISFRGSSPGETGMFLNNVPLYDFVRFSQLNGIGTFGIFNTAIVDELLVFPGNPPLEYGNTTSGLVAIKTTEEIPEKSVHTATVSLASYGFLIGRSLGEKQSLTAFSNYQPSGVIKALNADALQDIEAFSSIDLGVNYLNVLNDKTILKIFNYSLLEGYDFNYRQPTLSALFEQRKRRNFTVTNLRRKQNDHEFTFNSSISFSNTDFSFADTDITLDNFDAFGSLNYKVSLGKFRLKSGFAYDYRKRRFDGTFYTIDYAQGPEFPTESIDVTSELIRPELYTYLTYYLGNNWIFGGGVRGNLATGTQENFLSSQLSSKFKLNSNSSLVFAVGNYHKYDFGTEGESILNESGQLSLDYSYKTNNSLIMTASIFAKMAKVNNLENNLIGLELFAEGNIIDKLRGQISYSLIDGTSTNLEGIEFPNAFDLDYFIRGNLAWKINGSWTCNSNFSFRQGNYYRPFSMAEFERDLSVFRPEFSSPENQVRLPDYGIMDISLTKSIPVSEKLNIIVFGTINNVLNRGNIREFTYNFDYTEMSSALYQQRTVYFGAIVNF